MHRAACGTIQRGRRRGWLAGRLYGNGCWRLARRRYRRWLLEWGCLNGRCRLFGRRGFVRFRLRVSLRDIMTKEPPQSDGGIFIDGAGVGLLLGYAQLRELVKDLVRLNFQLPSQLINTNLVHKYKTIRRDAPHSLCEPPSSDSS
jgi:hypothetical protein